MKSALSLALIVRLAGSALPAAAQEQMGTAARFAGSQQTQSDSNWSRVRRLAPGTEIIVTVKDSPPARRYFVKADESDLTVSNVSDTMLQVIERIARPVVTEIIDPRRARAKGGDPALALPVFFLGGIAGAFIGAGVGGPCSGVPHCASDAPPRGLFVGGLVGGVGAVALAHNALFSKKTDGVVYRAP